MIQVVHLLADVLSHARLAAGAAGTRREVTWAVTARARTPSLPPLQGGELVLLPAPTASYHGGPDALPSMLLGFHEAGACGVVVWTEPSDAAKAAADSSCLPLILCGSVSAAELERSLVEHVARALRQGISAQEERPARLLEALAANRGIESILRVLSESVQRPAGYFPHTGKPVIHPPGSFQLTETELGGISAALDAGEGAARTDAGLVWAAPVERRGRRAGALVVLAGEEAPGAADALSLRQTAAAVAVETGRLDELEAAEERLRAELAEELFGGRPSGSVHERAAALGVALPLEGVVLALGGSSPDDPLPPQARRLRPHGIGRRRYPVLETSQRLLAYLPAEAATAPENELRLPAGVSAAWSEPVASLSSLPNAVDQASASLIVSQCLEGGRAVRFSNAGGAALLTALRAVPFARHAVARVMAPLVQYDEEHRGNLVQTLRVYLACGSSQSRAAHALHLHRNSLAYRLRRVEELTGRSLERPEDRLLLTVALTLHPML